MIASCHTTAPPARLNSNQAGVGLRIIQFDWLQVRADSIVVTVSRAPTYDRISFMMTNDRTESSAAWKKETKKHIGTPTIGMRARLGVFSAVVSSEGRHFAKSALTLASELMKRM